MKIDRLFKITFILIEKKSVTAQELAKEFGISVRTIYRDIDILSTCGIPVYTEKGRNGGIYIMEQYLLNKTLLTDDEQAQIVMSLQSIKATGQKDVSTALSKLKGIFQKNFDDWIEIDFSSWSNSDSDKKMFSTIREGILHSTSISFTYYNGKGEKSERIVEPYKLIFKGQSWYLFAYCKDKKDFRFFKLSRMENLNVNSFRFVKQKTDAFLNSYDGNHGDNIKLKLKIDNKMAFRVLDEFKDNIIETGNDGYIVESDIQNSKWLLSYLLSFGDAVEILEPEKIRKEYIDYISSIAKKYYI